MKNRHPVPLTAHLGPADTAEANSKATPSPQGTIERRP